MGSGVAMVSTRAGIKRMELGVRLRRKAFLNDRKQACYLYPKLSHVSSMVLR